jgi:hypothetical protein
VHEERAGKHVAQEQHDAEHLVRLDAAPDDPFREITRVGLQRLDAARLERVDVVVVDGGDLGEDLVRGHHAEELGGADPSDPLFTEVGPLVPQVVDELRQQSHVDVGLIQRQMRR